MSKAILISIKPKYVAKILNGEKTIEIRKTVPKCDLPIEVYIYCTKGKNGWCMVGINGNKTYFQHYDKNACYSVNHNYIGNGKVVAKFTLNKIRTSDMTNCLQGSCLSYDEVNEYTKGKKFYGWVIDNLVIFDRPKELWEFDSPKGAVSCDNCLLDKFACECDHCNSMNKAPQSWCYVEVKDE